MITSSFIFIPGIGEKTEEYLWKSGILSWDDFKKTDVPFLNEPKKRIIEDYLKLGREALDRKDSSFFAENLPREESWRLYKDFRDETLFLDIETTGLSRHYDVITLIGTYDGHNVRIFLRDNNLRDIVDYLRNYQIIVTFNGKLFDLRFIKKEFPGIKIPPVHIDLRYLLRSLGINGSLKDIERRLGINRDSAVEKRKWGHPIYSPFFYGGFLLPYIFLAYTLDISVAEGKYGRYRSCPYFLLRRSEFVGRK